MWSDSLLGLERAHLIRLSAWAIGSILAGSALFAWITIRRHMAPLLSHFAMQMAAWGAVDLAIVGWSFGRLGLRDYAGALHLQNLLWLNIGLDAGYAGIGLTLMVACLGPVRRHGGIGAGLGIIVQGLALLTFDAQLLAAIGQVR